LLPDLEPYRDDLRLLAEIQLANRLRTRIDPSDVVQETLLEAVKDLQQRDRVVPDDLPAWLRTILPNHLHNLLRDHQGDCRDVRSGVRVNGDARGGLSAMCEAENAMLRAARRDDDAILDEIPRHPELELPGSSSSGNIAVDGSARSSASSRGPAPSPRCSGHL